MLRRFAAFLGWLGFATRILGATAADFAGTWTWVQPNRNPPLIDEYSLQLNVGSGGQITGTYYGRAGPTPIVSVTLGSDLNFGVVVNTPNGDATTLYTLTTTGAITIRTPSTAFGGSFQTQTYTATRVGAPEIKSFVLPGSALVGQAVTFSVVAAGNAPLTYQWKKNSIAIPGATNASHTLAAAQLADSGTYACTVTNPLGSATSSSVNFVVSPQPVTPPTTPTTTTTTPTTPVTAPPTTVTGTPPRFTGPLGDLDVSLRSAVIVYPGAVGDAPITFQWFKDGVAMPGATGALSIPNVQKSDAGTYTVVAANAAGRTTSSPMVLRIKMVAPIITEQPKSVALIEGAPLTLSTAATADPDPSFQWYKNGMVYGSPVAGALRSTILLGGVTLADAGDYTCVITNDAGSVTTVAATVSVSRAARIVNLSSRGFAEGGTFTVGFVVEGSVDALVRAAGPALADFGISGALPDPVLRLSTATFVVSENDDWRPDLTPVFGAVGAFPFRSGSKDAAFLTSLRTGALTAVVRDRENRSGEVLLEVYDAAPQGAGGRLANVSTLGVLRAGGAIVSGFVIQGDGTIPVLIRAVGPTLTSFAVAEPLRTPQLELFQGSTRLAQNAGWSTATNATALSSAAARAGAFPLASSSADAAILIDLAAGSYTAHTSGGSGAVLFELYLAPSR